MCSGATASWHICTFTQGKEMGLPPKLNVIHTLTPHCDDDITLPFLQNRGGGFPIYPRLSRVGIWSSFRCVCVCSCVTVSISVCTRKTVSLQIFDQSSCPYEVMAKGAVDTVGESTLSNLNYYICTSHQWW